MTQGQKSLAPTRRDDGKGGRGLLREPKCRILRRIAIAVLFTILPSLLFYIYLYYSETAEFPTLQKNLSAFSIVVLVGLLTGASLFGFNLLLDGWLPWMRFFTSRFLAGFVTSVIIALTLVTTSAAASMELLGTNVFWQGNTTDDPDVKWKLVILIVAFVFIYKVIYALLYAYQHYAIAQIQELKRERKQLELQFEALKGQISPHYLFNSLNTISSLLFKDVQSAEQFIRRLAETYQYVLSTQNKRYVALSEELEFVQSYYYLLRIRFQQQLAIEINVPANILNTKIPPLTLQMLIENAVKHNAVTHETKLFIYITAEDNTYLKVINTKTGIIGNTPSFRVGLENIRQRYHFLTDKRVIVENKDKFIVSLPVLRHWEENVERKNTA